MIAALYTESVFEMHHRFEPSSIFLKYTNPSYPVPVRCEAYHCLPRILLRNEEVKRSIPVICVGDLNVYKKFYYILMKVKIPIPYATFHTPLHSI